MSSGGHCFAGRSVSRGFVIDVSPMAAVSAGGVATVGANTRLGRVLPHSRSMASPFPQALVRWWGWPG